MHFDISNLSYAFLAVGIVFIVFSLMFCCLVFKNFKHIKNDPNYFLPSNFEKFVLTGQVRTFYSAKVVPDEPKNIVYITGCGRSGTTYLFSLLSGNDPTR